MCEHSSHCRFLQLLLFYPYRYMGPVITFVTTHWVWIAFAIFYLINLMLGHKSQLDAWVIKHPKMGGILKLIRGMLPADPWLVLQGISLLIKGCLPAKLTPIVNIISNDGGPALPESPPDPGPTA